MKARGNASGSGVQKLSGKEKLQALKAKKEKATASSINDPPVREHSSSSYLNVRQESVKPVRSVDLSTLQDAPKKPTMMPPSLQQPRQLPSDSITSLVNYGEPDDEIMTESVKGTTESALQRTSAADPIGLPNGFFDEPPTGYMLPLMCISHLTVILNIFLSNLWDNYRFQFHPTQLRSQSRL